MKRTILAIIALLMLSSGPGCLHNNVARNQAPCGEGGECGHGGCGGLLGGLVARPAEGIHATQGWRHQAPQLGPAGPPVGTYGYPYYTLRGPRDFLASDPPSIGN